MTKDKKPRYQINISIAQHKFLTDVLKASISVGDCRLRGLNVEFDDYEGLNAFQGRLRRMSIETTRAYVTMNSIDNKITAAVAAEKVIL